MPTIIAVTADSLHTLVQQVLNVAFLTVGTLCTLVGSAGYYMYGNAVRDVVTFNLPKVPQYIARPTAVAPSLVPCTQYHSPLPTADQSSVASHPAGMHSEQIQYLQSS